MDELLRIRRQDVRELFRVGGLQCYSCWELFSLSLTVLSIMTTVSKKAFENTEKKEKNAG